MIRKVLDIFARRPRRGEPKHITSEDAYHFALGSVLGDGTVNKSGSYIEIEHASIWLIAWKRCLAISFGLVIDRETREQILARREANNLGLSKGAWAITNPMPFTTKKRPPQPGSSRTHYRGFSFCTRALFSSQWRDLFYKEVEGRAGKFRKSLPPNIADYFWGDLALAIYFIDDGWFQHDRRTACLACGEWTAEECGYMKDCLKNNFNLEVSVYNSGDTPHHFYVKPQSYAEFYRRVNPYLENLRSHFKNYDKSPSAKNKILVDPSLIRRQNL